ncbi:Fc.00g000270.m01.CDS01 [Cosmosporella sp. VM-42]
MPPTNISSTLEEDIPEGVRFEDHRTAGYHLRHNRRLILSVLILAISYLTFGYDASVISGCLAMPAFIAQFSAKQANGTTVLSASSVSIITATATAAGVPAVFVVGYSAEKLGRKKTLWLGCVITLFGTSLQTGSTNVAGITVGRVIASKRHHFIQSSASLPKSYAKSSGMIIDLGYFIMVAMTATLSTEIAPPPIRGAIGALSVLFIQTAAVMTSGISWATYYMGSSAAYRIPLGLQNLFPLLIAVGILYVRDSPTSYLIKGEDAKAEESLRRVRQGYSEEQIVKEMESLKWQASLRKADKEVGWTEIFKGPNRRRTILSMFVGVTSNVSGGIFATGYATIFLQMVGSSDPFLLVFALNIIALGGSIIGLVLVDIIGRRAMILIALTSIFITDAVIGTLGFADAKNPAVIKAIAAFSLIFAFFNATFLGPLAWLNAAEFPTARFRNITTAFTFFMFSVTSLAVNYIVPYIANAGEENFRPKTYVIFAGCIGASLITAYFYYPEIKGRSPAEKDEMFEARLPARTFKGHLCTHITENIKIKVIQKGDVQEIEILNEPTAVGEWP